ncbi:MAG: NTP transferase domain-containing protein [Treponema sp.]|jgi:spore coat polysaccharide biosynthesis protein SpsF|nr:NTP transferase domain-containing protein [Treponema sp.]
MTALVLQARLDSARLPQKALLPLGGEPLILRVMEALGGIWDLHILACPEDCVSAFKGLAQRAGYELVPGAKEDVLNRYCTVIRRFGIDRVVRATGDNPFVFADAAEALDREGEVLGADYAGYAALPCGAGVEAVSAAALLRAEREAAAPAEREHVCPYLYGHPERFLLHRPLAPRIWQGPSLRLTVDTAEDYDRARALYRSLEREEGAGPRRGKTVIEAYRRLFSGGREQIR